jgi:hypothetical protein
VKTLRLALAAAAVAAALAPATSHAGIQCTIWWHERGIVPANPFVADPELPDCAW